MLHFSGRWKYATVVEMFLKMFHPPISKVAVRQKVLLAEKRYRTAQGSPDYRFYAKLRAVGKAKPVEEVPVLEAREIGEKKGRKIKCP